jgi:hypothetical protein
MFMGGKIWCILALLVSMSMAYANTATSLNAWAIIYSQRTVGAPVPVTFMCDYRDMSQPNNPPYPEVPNATVYVNVNTLAALTSTNYLATLVGTDYEVNVSLNTFYPYTYYFYCNASAAGYTPQLSTPQNLTIMELTTLTQSTTPQSGSAAPVSPTFICGCYDELGNPFGTYAEVSVNISGNVYSAPYNPTTKDYRYTVVNPLSAGAYPWDCLIYIPAHTQAGPLQQYYVISCPAPYCSGNNLCTYSGSNCTVTCSYCPSGLCSGGGCRGGGGSPLLVKTPISGQAEQMPPQPVSNTWSFAVIIVLIVGLGIGYFVAKDYMAAAPAGRKRR